MAVKERVSRGVRTRLEGQDLIARNNEVVREWNDGADAMSIGVRHGITQVRVYQILAEHRKQEGE